VESPSGNLALNVETRPRGVNNTFSPHEALVSSASESHTAHTTHTVVVPYGRLTGFELSTVSTGVKTVKS
jgi:hypothetical protein